MNRTSLTIALVALLGCATGVGAQESAEDVRGPVRGPTPDPVSATLRASAEVNVTVDGRIDEEAWETARVMSNFVQGEPVEGGPAEHDTEVRMIVTEDAILVAARMWDADPSSIATQLVRRDGEGAFDWFKVGIDTNLDRRTGYIFTVTAAGVQGDAYMFDDEQEDDAWDAVWQSGVQIDDRGWTAEIRIPLSQIRFSASPDPQSWGINFARRRIENAETSYYALQSRTRRGKVSQFARLDDVVIANAVRRIEARPYILSSLERAPAEAGNPFFDGSAGAARVGTDLRVGIGSAFALDATINPDFGQVEADPAQINLTAFEVFQEERRPFFVEDANLLGFSLAGMRNSLFYSRRIGRSPSGGSLSGSDFTDRPTNATILGAAKLTGRTSGGLSVGALFAATQDEKASAYFAASDSLATYRVEPAAQFGVLRMQQDFNDGMSRVSAIVTGMRRDLPGNGSFAFLPGTAYSTGLDFEHQWGDRTWAVGGLFALSHVRGDSLAIARIQRSSNHYWQRPDATRDEIDPTARSMTGAQWRVTLDKQRGDHWTGGLWLGEITHGFEVNDIGYSNDREKLDAGFRISYREISPAWIFRNYNFSLWSFHNWSHEALDDPWSAESWRKAQTSSFFSLSGGGQFTNFWSLNTSLRYSPDTFSRTATRGGPVMVDPGSLSIDTRFNTDRRKSVNLDGTVSFSKGADGSGDRFTLRTGIEFRPSPTLEVSIGPNWSTTQNAAQYVTSTSTMEYEPTFGRRYLFANLEQKTLSMEARVNWTFSPTLTFQLYAQPFISSGDYVSYRQLAEAGSFSFREFDAGLPTAGPNDAVACLGGSICRVGDTQHVDFDGDGIADYAFGDRDFNFRSLLGNAVLRWEYRPGSTIFLVWQRQQSVSTNLGDFDVGRDVDALFSAPAENVFMVKVNLWLGL